MLNQYRPMRSMFLNMILGRCMGMHCLSFLVGLRILDFTSTVRESVLDWASGLDYLLVTVGAGTTGDATGIMARLYITTTRSTPTVEPS